jgi:PAS domain S-box-containing protein
MNTRLNQAQPVVLVADDEKAMRVIIRHTLQRDGYAVLEAGNGAEALALFQQHSPDVVLLDAVMPVVDGFAACERLRELPEGAHVPILVVTNFNDSDSVERAFAAGATDYATKPIQWAVLRHRLKQLVQTNRAYAALRRSEARLRSVVDQGSHPIIFIGREYEVQMLNESARTQSVPILGRLLAPGESILDNVPEDNHEGFRRAFTSVLSGKTLHMQRLLRRSDGSEEWYHVYFSPVRDELGAVTGVCITLDTASEEALREAMLGDLVASAHEEVELALTALQPDHPARPHLARAFAALTSALKEPDQG